MNNIPETGPVVQRDFSDLTFPRLPRRKMNTLFKRIRRAWSDESHPDLFPKLCEDAGMVLCDADWQEVETFVNRLNRPND